MKEHNRRIVIVGNGAAGNSAASAIRKADKRAAVTLISQEPFPFYSACVLSKMYLSGEISRERVFIKELEQYSREEINLILGKKVTAIYAKEKKVILGDEEITYDKLILATGGNPIVPSLPGIGMRGVFKLKSIADAESILNWPGRKAVVIGAGPIGVEASVSLRKRGWDVVLLELLDHVLPTMFDPDISLRMKRELESLGIEVRTKEKALSFVGQEHVCGVITEKGIIDCDLIILALGMKPNVDLAKEAGIEIGSLGGIKVDEHLRTSVEDIYAAGDCVESKDLITGESMLCLLWYNARRQGMVAGLNALGAEKTSYGAIRISTVEIKDILGISIGHTKSSLRQEKVDIIEGKDTGYCRLFVADGNIIGAQLLGEDADIGFLVSTIRRCRKLESIQKMLSDSKVLCKSPLNVKLHQLLKRLYI